MSAPTNFKSLIGIFIDLINTALPVLAGIGLLVFFWGLAKFIRNAGEVKDHTEGKDLMIWGVVGLFVLFSVWGIVGFVQSSFGIRSVPFGIPYLPSNNTSQIGFCTYPNGSVVSGYSPAQCSAAKGGWNPANNN